jgi:hypothetical protein
MTPDEIIAAFERATRLFAVFRYERRNEPPSMESGIIEAQIRLEQSWYLLQEFRHAQLSYDDRERALKADSSDLQKYVTASQKLVDMIKLYGEAFYYFAWRAKQTCDRIDGLAFDPIGVRNVRNRMIEHPDKSGGVMVSHWMFDYPRGLVLAPANLQGDVGLDKGLYPNAQEFIEKCLAKLSLCVRQAP